MSKYFFAILFVLSFTQVYAQENCSLRGEVRDSLNFPVFDASVSAFNTKNEGVGFTFTDTEGFFKLDLPCNDTYDVEVEHLDYLSYEEQIKLDKSKTVKFNLKPSLVSLEEAVIRAKQPITIKGDTIEYDADSFRTAVDENLEDLLKKLPGLQVEDGKVYYEGKEITTIKVGNREVLGGNTKLLTKNLPADAIDKVQLNKKFKANPFANSLSDDEEAMLNIELKEEKKSLIFGNLTLGGDADKHTDAQTKLFYFSPKTDGTAIADYNTYGKQVFTYEDYFTFLGGFSEMMEEGSSFSLRQPPNRLSLGSAQNAAEMDALLGALHFGYEPNKKWFTNAFVLMNSNNIKFNSTQERIGEEITFRDENTNDQKLFSTLGRVRADYTPDSRSQWKYRGSFNYVQNEDHQFANTFINGESAGGRDNLRDNDAFSIRQSLSYIRKVARDDNMGIYVRHQFSNDRPELAIFSESTPLIIDDLYFYNLNQNKKLLTQNFQVYGIYNHLLTNTSNIRLKLGANFSWQELTNSIYENDTRIEENNFLTDSDFDFTELYADMTYTKKWGIFKMDAGVGVHNFREKTNTLYNSAELNKTKIIPHINTELKITNTQNLYLSYSQDYKLPNLTDLSDGYDINSYYSVYKGFLGLKEALYHNASLRFGYFNSYNFLNFYAGTSYSRNVDNMQSTSDISVIPQVNSLINNPEDDENISAYFGGSKRFTRYYSIQLNGNLNLGNYYTNIILPFVNEDGDLSTVSERTQNKSFSQNYTLTNKFKIRRKVEFDLGFNFMHSDFKSRTDNKFLTYRPFGNMAWAISDKFLFQSDYSYRMQYQDGTLINESQLLNASLRYHLMKGTYLTLVGGNLLGTKQIASSSFDAVNNQTIVNTRDVLGRYFLVQLRFKF